MVRESVKYSGTPPNGITMMIIIIGITVMMIIISVSISRYDAMLLVCFAMLM